MNAYDTYKFYNVIKGHFNSTWDIRKYGFSGGKRFSEIRFNSLTNTYQFEKVGKDIKDDYEAKIIFASNLVRDPSVWITSCDRETSFILKRYLTSKAALIEDIKNEIECGLLTDIKTGDIINRIVTGNISIELVTYLNKCIPLIKLLKQTQNEFLVKNIESKVEKYDIFCTLNTVDELNTIKQIVRQLLTDTNR